MFTTVIIPAAGFGERMGATIAKQFLPLQGKPVLVHTLERFQQCDAVNEIIIATQKNSLEQIASLLSEFHITKAKPPVVGGERRQDSIAHALNHIDEQATIICVHDAVRPFVHIQEIIQTIETAKYFGASIIAVRAKDTIKKASTDGRVEQTLERSSLWMVQTPQTFQRKILLDAYAHAEQQGITATDDSFLVEKLGVLPVIIEGSYENIKITTPDDLLLAELLAKRFVP